MEAAGGDDRRAQKPTSTVGSEKGISAKGKAKKRSKSGKRKKASGSAAKVAAPAESKTESKAKKSKGKSKGKAGRRKGKSGGGKKGRDADRQPLLTMPADAAASSDSSGRATPANESSGSSECVSASPARSSGGGVGGGGGGIGRGVSASLIGPSGMLSPQIPVKERADILQEEVLALRQDNDTLRTRVASLRRTLAEVGADGGLSSMVVGSPAGIAAAASSVGVEGMGR